MMTNMHFTPRKATTALSFFLSIFLMAFSCQDHVVPEVPEAPEIQTLELNVGNNSVTFSVVFNKVGEIPVTEYGILYKVTDFGSNGIIPTEADSKEVFSQAITTAPISKQVSVVTDGNAISYRAYAKLANGATIFGEVKEGNLTIQ
jgi:hypothetical protein